jgi:threonine 3-dehydrogenase
MDVKVKILYASLFGSDLHIYNNDKVFRDRVQEGQIIGHEFCGEIIALGKQVTTLAVGDIVSAESHVACGSCHFCLNGNPHICQEVSALGFDRPGGFAEVTVIPYENAVPIPKTIHADIGACLEPFGNAVYTARCVDLVNKVVWVPGCGPQGLMALAIAKASGARMVIATEVKPERLELAKKMLVAHANSKNKNSEGYDLNDLTLNPAEDPEVLKKIYRATDGLGVDVVIEMSGFPQAIEDAFLALRKGGHIIALGLSAASKLEIDWNKGIVLKEANIRGIYGRRLYETWTEVEHMLTTGKVSLEPIIYPKYFSLEEFETAFELVKNGKAAKVIFKPNGFAV